MYQNRLKWEYLISESRCFSCRRKFICYSKERLKLFLGKYYSGLLSSPSRTFLDVSLTQIRPVKVSVLGNVNTPGPHLVNGMATVLNALYASGGIDTLGTLRDVKVYRNNKLIKTIDLYDYITQGNIDQDIRLSNNDILFVGPRISSVTYLGVKKEAIYELKELKLSVIYSNIQEVCLHQPL